jgi:hypothetical protein
LRRPLCKVRQDLLAQNPEHIPVAIEMRDRDAAEAVQNRPFLLVVFEVFSIDCEVSQSQALHAPADALADLAAHLAKAVPPETEPGQGPL